MVQFNAIGGALMGSHDAEMVGARNNHKFKPEYTINLLFIRRAISSVANSGSRRPSPSERSRTVPAVRSSMLYS